MHSQCRCEISVAIKSQFHENESQSSKVIRRTRKAVYFKWLLLGRNQTNNSPKDSWSPSNPTHGPEVLIRLIFTRCDPYLWQGRYKSPNKESRTRNTNQIKFSFLLFLIREMQDIRHLKWKAFRFIDICTTPKSRATRIYFLFLKTEWKRHNTEGYNSACVLIFSFNPDTSVISVFTYP